MTEFEIVSASQEYQNVGMTILMNFFSILTAYLAAGYLSAHRLTRAMAIFVTAMFVLLSMLFVLAYYRNVVQSIGLAGEMSNFAKAGKGLTWHPISSLPLASLEFSGYIFMTVLLTIMTGGIVGGVYFFYDCRKRNPIGSP